MTKSSLEIDNSKDTTTRPSHYKPICKDDCCIESIEFFKQSAKSPDHYSEYLRLTAMKYLYRFWSKEDTLVNAKKAKQFIDWLVENESEKVASQ